MKKIKIMDSLFDEQVQKIGVENITDEDITDALIRMRNRGEEVPNGKLLEFFEENGEYFVFIEN